MGSGASAVASITALNARGIVPTVFECSEEQTETVSEVPSFAGRMKGHLGSYDAYRVLTGDDNRIPQETLARPSRFLGGFTRVWGGTFEVDRYLRRSLKNVTFDEKDLNLLSSLVPTTTSEELSGVESLSARRKNFRTVNDVLVSLGSRSEFYGTEVEPTKIAVESRSGYARKCRGAGVCLTGCPNHAIWFAGDEVSRLEKAKKLQLMMGHKAISFAQEQGSVRLLTQTRDSNHSFSFDRLVLAAGPLGTAEIVLRSTPIDTLSVHETLTAFGGIVSPWNIRRQEKQPELSYLNIATSNSSSLVQVYPPTPGVGDEFARRYPKLRAGGKVAAHFSGHLLPSVVYFGEHVSPTIETRLSNSGRGLSLSYGVPKISDLREVLRPIKRLLLSSGFFLPWGGLDIPGSGSGFHFGASLPMGTCTDEIGQLSGLRNIHIVDASVLPKIEVGSITAITMLNAIRIIRTAAADAY